jgi:hypothetical protein
LHVAEGDTGSDVGGGDSGGHGDGEGDVDDSNLEDDKTFI